MPTVLRSGPYRVFFYANENREPPHVHVVSGDGRAVFWLETLGLREAKGYTPTEIARLRRIIGPHRAEMLRRWHEFFDREPSG